MEPMPRTSKAAWLEELRELLKVIVLPCCLVECEGNFWDSERPPQLRETSPEPQALTQPPRLPPRPTLRERLVCANEPWYRLFERSEEEVAGKPFSEIRGLQGPLTTQASMVRLACLLISKAKVEEGLRIVNYTSSGRPLEIELRVDIFKRHGRNAFFTCSVVKHREIQAALRQPLEPEPEPEEARKPGLQ